MLKLLTCAQGHFWEVEEAETNGAATHEGNFAPLPVCPTCGSSAGGLPDLDLDLAPTETTAVPVPLPAVPSSPPPLRDAEGRPVVAGYEIHEALGRTPRGVLVFRARQVLVNRVVTLKVVFGKDDPGQRAWGCLRGEATALGKLIHPNVVQIFEVGERERHLFYNAVEQVDGPTLAEKVHARALTLRQAVQVVETLARAVHAAHEKGIIHRTLKPASVLVAGQADAPVEQCTLKITDFGLVGRPVEGDVNDLDLQGSLPFYLAPEQAWGRVKDFGPATDVYALGAILYELLAGRPPFVADDWTLLVEKIQGKEAPPPSSLQRRVPPDLDAVCRKCLAKNPRRRYASALDLADDLRRFLDGYPVKVRPRSIVAQMSKWVKRSPLKATFVLLLVVALASTLTAYLIGRSEVDTTVLDSALEREKRATQDANNYRFLWQAASQRARPGEYFHRILLAEKALAAGRERDTVTLLEGCPDHLRHWEWYYLRGFGPSRPDQEAPLRMGVKAIVRMAYSTDGRRVAAGTEVGADKKSELRVWDVGTRKEVLHDQFDGPVDALAFSPDGLALAIAHGRTVGWGSRLVVRNLLATELPIDPAKLDDLGGNFRNLNRRDPLFALDVPQARITDLTYATESLMVAGRADGRAILYGAEEGNEMATTPSTVLGNGTEVNRLRLAYIGDSMTVALCSPAAREVRVWNRLTGEIKTTVNNPTGRATCVAFGAPDRLAVGRSDGTISILDAYQTTIQTLVGHSEAVTAVAFSRDGKRVATAAGDKAVKVWDPGTGLEILTLKDLPAAATGLAFGPDGRRLVVSTDNEIRFYGNEKP